MIDPPSVVLICMSWIYNKVIIRVHKDNCGTNKPLD